MSGNEYSISIIDNGEPVVIVFQDKETKEKYVSGEYKYCKSEILGKNVAIGSVEVANSVKLLSLKHVEYAKKMGYNPIGYENKRWFYNPVTPDKTFA